MNNRILSVPNQITFLRLGFLPFFLITIRYQHYGWALGILVAAGLSDGVDGWLARRWNQRTTLGMFIDPIADKLLLSSSYFMLALEKKIAWWLTILVLGRDVILLTASAVILLVVGYQTFPPSVYGKINTFVQIILVFLVLISELTPYPWLKLVRHIFIDLVAFFTVFSGLHYSIVVAQRLSRSHAAQ